MNYGKFSVPKGILMMALGYASFLMGLMVLSNLQPSDPHWFGLLVMCMTWLSCFLVIAGFAYLSIGFIVRTSSKYHTITIDEEQMQ